MPNLNIRPHKIANTNNQYAPGVFTIGATTVIVTEQAAVDALLAKGWARTAD